ncbi:2-nitropropane dioxygenase [Microbacterium sp. Root61]|uniref:NAD(P)H-dependent flavin oxidoreductase n=1 Tax=Microbacterium sp. Root61 TaxID=1736570 RepID=UPI0006FBEC10|nr:nitronate monooxygenase family protein [Microbacterium sp. Root61]KRA24669.1 2-nitropropane dioxygenase [Microbacterium sp. Root61]
MALPDRIASRLAIPVICAPMFLISEPQLVVAACKAGVLGSFPRQNTRTREDFEAWLRQIREELDAWTEATGRVPGPIAVNIPTTLDPADIAADLDVCVRYGVDIIITSVGKPHEVTRLAHDRGLLVYHDVTTIAFAEKAIDAGVDGLNCIGAGGGGHSGTVSHLALIPKIRSIYDGTIALAGAVSTGSVVRAGEILGADLAFMGSRFAATVESHAHAQQKQWMVAGASKDLSFTPKVNGMPANWMLASLAAHGIDLGALPEPVQRGHDHLPEGVHPWRDLWSAGQGIELIDDIPSVAELVDRLAAEYLAACAMPDRSPQARRHLAVRS